MRILPPDENSKRASFADWLELLALTNPAGRASFAELQAVLRIESDDRTRAEELDPGTDDTPEPSITNKSLEDLEEKVIEELEFRCRVIKSAYPFEVNISGRSRGSLVLKPDHLDPRFGYLFYVFCLLDSAFRDKLLLVATKGDKELERRIGSIFQICSCLAVGGYLGLEVVSFGFPRANGDGFLPALRSAWERYGSFEVIDKIPYGFDDRLKDGGVDIIAWRHFNDPYAGTVLMFVQVASGMDWKEKAVSGDIAGIRNWFSGESGGSFENFVPAICIPFPLWFDLPDPPKSPKGKTIDFQQGARMRFVYREKKFGVIFDRGRIAYACGTAVSRDPANHPHIDGLDLVPEVAKWVDQVLTSLFRPMAAA